MKQPSGLRRLLREPLLHFLLIGAAIVAAGRLSPPAGAPPTPRETILITAETIGQFIDAFTDARSRPPSPEEVREFVDGYLREEVLYREALSLGLDRGDSIIRRHLAQRMQSAAEGLAPIVDPTDDDLEALRRAEPERFAEPGEVSFQHVFLNPERRPESTADAAAMLVQLNDPHDPADPKSLGDPFLLPQSFERLRVDQVSRTFGDAFAAALDTAPPGVWSGPVSSAYGLHLFRVSERTPPRLPPLIDIRSRVRSVWLSNQTRHAAEEFETKLLAKYDIVVEPLESQNAAQPPARGEDGEP